MLKIGDVLDNTYEIKSQIGSGGGGIIYKGYHLRMCIPVAIKLMKSEAKGIIDQRSEVDLLKQLKNDYIPQVLDFIVDGNDVYTVMEFVEGSNFKQLITSGRTFSENDVLRYIKQLCTAVKYLHDHNPPIIHSDIKPTNIMLKPDDSICLIDFNISTVVSENGAYSVGGSKGFAAPEQFKKVIDVPVDVDEFHEETRFLGYDDETEFIGSEESSFKSSLKTKNVSKAYVDMRTDIYGIGSSMYYMLTGRVPTTGNTDFRGVKVSSKTQKIIRKCMNPDPSKRYANVRELENALSSKGSSAIIASVAAVLIIGIGAVAVINNNSSEGMESNNYYNDTGKTETVSTAEKTEDTTFEELAEKEPLEEESVKEVSEQKEMPEETEEEVSEQKEMLEETEEEVSESEETIEKEEFVEEAVEIICGSNSIQPGDEISFGNMLWLVLEKNDDTMLITTKDIYEIKAYNSEDENVTWETCSLRTYLNNDFYNSFSDSEKARIVYTVITGSDNPLYGTSGGNNTTDKIFIQSIDEIKHYFGADSYDPEIYDTGEYQKWIWLRTPGKFQDTAMGVYTPCLRYAQNNEIDSAFVNLYGCQVHYEVGIRPTMWIKY